MNRSFFILIFGFLGFTVSAQTTRVRLKQLELAPDTTYRYVIVADTSTQEAYWAKLDSLGLGGGGASTFYLKGDNGSVQTLSAGDTIEVLSGTGLTTYTISPDQVLLTLDSTGVTAGTYNFASVTVNAQGRITLISGGTEIDGSITNEGMLGVAAGGANDATIYTNTSGNLGTSIAGSWGMLVSETTSANGGTVTLRVDSSQAATQYDITGFISGAGTSGRVPIFTGTQSIGNGTLRDDGTLLAIGGATVTGYSFYDYSTGAWRMATGTTAQRPTPQAGALRFNTTLAFSETHNGTNWLQSDFPTGTDTYTLRYVNSSGKWEASSLLKNTGSVIQINTTAANKTFNVGGNMFLADGNSNTFIQGGTGATPNAGNHNVAIGFNAGIGLATGGETNVMIGRSAGIGITTGDNNLMIGFNAGTKFSTGVGNISIGHESVNGSATAATGNYNFCMSYRAGYILTTGSGNFFLGPYAGGLTTTGSNNLYLGYYAGATSTQTGSSNVGVGNESMQNVTDLAGSFATAIGYRSGYGSSEVDNNVFIGRESGNSNTYTNIMAIGYGATASQNSQIALGTGSVYTQLKARNYAFNIDQTVGAGQDGYALKYNHSTGEIELASVSAGTMSSFTLAGSSGTPQTVSDGQTATIAAGFGLASVAGATRTVTISADSITMATQYDLTQIPTIYNADGSINDQRLIDLDYTAGSFNLFWDNGAGDTREFTLGDGASTYTTQDGLWFADYAGTAAGEMQVTSAQTYFANAVGATTSSITVTASSVTTATATSSKSLGATGAENWDFGSGTKITMLNPGKLGINDTSPEELLDVGGVTKTRQLVGQDNTPSMGTNANAGTGRSASITTSHSSDLAGRISLTTGTGLTAGEWFTITWAVAYSNPPAVMLMPEDANAASLAGLLYVVPTTTGVSIAVNTTSASYESKTYTYNYIVVGGK